MAKLLDPVELGELSLLNRVVMAPMTRSRATPQSDLPLDLHRDYYGQRASAGLIISEGVHPSIHGKGYCRTPGIYNADQVQSWSFVTKAVHERGGKIVLQLMHTGRIGSCLNKRREARTVAPSAIRAAGTIFTDSAGAVEMDVPEALETSEIPGLVEEYRQAALNARSAGFDGVELHCMSGYLPMQFLSTSTNRRTDEYGGTLNGRLRFVVEVIDALVEAVGAGRVGIRICPGNPFNDIHDDDPVATYEGLLKAISPHQLAYLHVVRSSNRDFDSFTLGRTAFTGPLIVNDGFDFAKGQAAIKAGLGEAVSYGRYFIANPDLVERFRQGARLTDFDRRTLYTVGAKGYSDYDAMVGGCSSSVAKGVS